jgi:hypothetical protein
MVSDYLIAGSVDSNPAQSMDIPVRFSILTYKGRGACDGMILH